MLSKAAELPALLQFMLEAIEEECALAGRGKGKGDSDSGDDGSGDGNGNSKPFPPFASASAEGVRAFVYDGLLAPLCCFFTSYYEPAGVPGTPGSSLPAAAGTARLSRADSSLLLGSGGELSKELARLAPLLAAAVGALDATDERVRRCLAAMADKGVGDLSANLAANPRVVRGRVRGLGSQSSVAAKATATVEALAEVAPPEEQGCNPT